MERNELKPCPFCGGKAKLVFCDDEGNIHGEEYSKNPWSGLNFQIVHDIEENDGCPIAKYEGETMGVYNYDTEEEAREAWNRRADK